MIARIHGSTTEAAPRRFDRIAATALALVFVAAPLRAVYAPIPPLEQGKALTVYLSSGVYYDTNVFGAETGRIESFDFQFAPSLAFNASLAPRTFLSLLYRLSLDDFPDRPGKKLLDSHEAIARLAHTFSPETDFDLTESYQISKNPESLLPGVGTLLSADQSYRRSQTDGRLSTTLTRRNGLLFKARVTTYAYENEGLARELDRDEFLGGVSAAHTLLPTLKSLAEYRYQLIQYRTLGEEKDKQSHFLLGGLDYALNEVTAASARAGLEYRQRRGDRNTLAPYVEIGGKRDYAKGSFVSFGYSHSYEENSTIQLFTDSVVDRFFVNWEHVITPKLTGTASAVWEPTILRGRRNISPDRRETNTRVGLALVYRPLENVSVSATIDLDRVHSEQAGRGLKRERYGVSAKYAF